MWKYEDCELGTGGVSKEGPLQRIAPVREHEVRWKYDGEGLRKKVEMILDEKVEWESVDVVRIVEVKSVDGWEEEDEGRFVVLVSMIWPIDEEEEGQQLGTGSAEKMPRSY